MSLKHVDIESALRRLADHRIEEAMREGKFDKLSGAGQPLDLDPMPAEEEARLNWWVLRILRQNDFTPEEVQWRKRIDHLKAELDVLRDEKKLHGLVMQINVLTCKVNTLGTNALKAPVAPVSEDSERMRLRERLALHDTGT